MKTILFQGDSITDCGRSRDIQIAASQYPGAFAASYPYLVSSSPALDEPGAYKFINRGIGGHRADHRERCVRHQGACPPQHPPRLCMGGMY